ncbi:MAG TPA: hypothetical protein VM736_06035 [Gemmatimonadales bacterium]|nr:hypothetical protein [Gemmatimonadales bacterium]
MKTFIRHLVLCSLPVLFGAGSGRYFTTIQGSCAAMVGALFAGKCAGRQREYRVKFELGGAAAGTLIAASLGAWLEHRRRRVVQGAAVPLETTTPVGEQS